MDPLCHVLSLEAVLVGIARYLTRRWTRAFVRALSPRVAVDAEGRRKVVEASWDVCLIALSHDSDNTALRLYQLQLDDGQGWKELSYPIPCEATNLVGAGTSLYALGGSTE